MKIAAYDFFMIGKESQSFPIPPLHGHGINSVSPHSVTDFLDKIAILNLGNEVVYIQLGPSPGHAGATIESATECPPGETTIITRKSGDTHFGAISASELPSAIGVGLGA